MCYFSIDSIRKQSKSFISGDDFSDIAEKYFPLARRVYLSCKTEPFMHKDFLRFVNVTKSYGVPFISLVTNGTLLTKRNIDGIAESQINDFYLNNVTYAATYTNKSAAENRLNSIAIPWLEWVVKVYEKCFHYAPALEVNRHPKGGPPLLHLIPNNPHWISGNAAFWTAGVHGHKNIYLIGFDFKEYGKDQNSHRDYGFFNYTEI